MIPYERFTQDAEKYIELNEGWSLEVNENGFTNLYGEISTFNNHELVDIYSIRIIPTLFYPDKFPQVFETSGKIPANIDWHVYPVGHFCICTSTEETLKCIGGINLSDFIEKEVKPFLYNQTHRRKRGYFLRERSHGILGELEFLFQALETKNLFHIINFFKFLLQRKEPLRTALCFCGSNEKYRHCHRTPYRKFFVLPDREIYKIIAKLQSIIEKFKNKNIN